MVRPIQTNMKVFGRESGHGLFLELLGWGVRAGVGSGAVEGREASRPRRYSSCDRSRGFSRVLGGFVLRG